MPGEVVSPVGKGKNHAEALNRLPYLQCWTGTCFWVLLENYKNSVFPQHSYQAFWKDSTGSMPNTVKVFAFERRLF